MSQQTLSEVKEYYGKVLKGTKDLQTNACCSTESIPDSHKKALAQIDTEILDKYYGCGSPIPPALEGATVLDLGCGTGRDVYLASKLVGENGHVIGLDMTDEQLDVARKHQDSQAKAFGFSKSNVTFTKGYIEDLKAAGIEDNSVDLVISNCVINLSPDKDKVYQEIFRVLKPGGEMYISDVFSDRRIPESLRQDPVLYGECLSGALYVEDFRRTLVACGIADFRVTSQRPITIENPEIEDKIGHIDFSSINVRAFKLGLEDVCEDYGQIARYKGTIQDNPSYFDLDDHHRFESKKPVLVCGNTADMLSKSRYAKHFEVTGDKSTHYGFFDCSDTEHETSSDCGEGSSCC
ncbi:methyltransferase domain-containing protein [bacterium]|jgi:arsenite methyltransferase|nr:methyltransferase domain-containing protein [bacterium]